MMQQNLLEATVLLTSIRLMFEFEMVRLWK